MTEEHTNDELKMPEDEHVHYSAETESIDSGKIPVWQQLTLLGVLMFLLLGGAVTPAIIAFFSSEKDSIPAAIPVSEEIPTRIIKQSNNDATEPFAEVAIAGSAAFVWDVQSQRALFKKNEQKALPLASVTKLMTALVAHELLSEEATVAISDEAMAQYGSSGLYQGEVFDRLTLSDMMLMSSSNDGAYALAAAAGVALSPDDGANAFVHAMNVRAEELGLHNTSFRNPSGLDLNEEESGANGSARDITFLMEHILLTAPDILALTTREEARVYSDSFYHDAENTNYYINEIPGLIGSKTGYTDLAGGNLVVAYNAGLNHPVIISVLGSSRQERFTDVLALVAATQEYVAQ